MTNLAGLFGLAWALGHALDEQRRSTESALQDVRQQQRLLEEEPEELEQGRSHRASSRHTKSVAACCQESATHAKTRVPARPPWTERKSRATSPLARAGDPAT